MNNPNHRAVLTGTGAFLPAKTLTNDDLSRMVDTSDEWIYPRTGIRSRHIAAEGENVSDMAAAAGRQAIENAGARPEEIDLLVLATITPDTPLPASSCLVQTSSASSTRRASTSSPPAPASSTRSTSPASTSSAAPHARFSSSAPRR